MSVMLILKIPTLVKVQPKETSTLEVIKEKGKNIAKLFSKERLLHKALSKFRVYVLRLENKTSDLLSNLRQKSSEKKDQFTEDYWSKVKKKK